LRERAEKKINQLFSLRGPKIKAKKLGKKPFKKKKERVFSVIKSYNLWREIIAVKWETKVPWGG